MVGSVLSISGIDLNMMTSAKKIFMLLPGWITLLILLTFHDYESVPLMSRDVWRRHRCRSCNISTLWWMVIVVRMTEHAVFYVSLTNTSNHHPSITILTFITLVVLSLWSIVMTSAKAGYHTCEYSADIISSLERPSQVWWWCVMCVCVFSQLISRRRWRRCSPVTQLTPASCTTHLSERPTASSSVDAARSMTHTPTHTWSN